MRWKWILATTAVLILLLCIGIWAQLARYDYNAFKPHISKLVEQATGRSLTIAGDIKFQLGLRPALVVEDIHFENVAWGTRPNAIDVKRIEIQIYLLALLRRTLEVKRLILIEPSVLFEIDQQGRNNLAFDKPAGDTAIHTELEGLGVNDVRIQNGVFTFKDARSNQEYVITRASLKATAPAIDHPLQIELTGNLRDQQMTTTGTLGRLTAILKAEQPWPIRLQTRISELMVTTSGSIQNPLSGSGLTLDLTAEGPNFKPVAAFIGKPIPLNGPFRISGRLVDPAPKILELQQTEIVLGNDKLSGTLRAELDKPRPYLTANLSSALLDLRPLLPASAPVAKKSKIFPSQPLPIEALQALNADLSLRIKQLMLPRFALHDVNVQARLLDGQLTVKPLQAEIGGGTMDGHVHLSPKNAALAMAAVLQVNRFNVGRMLKELELSQQLDGRLDVDVELKGSGSTIAAVMGALNGTTSVVMGKGQLDNHYLELIGGDLSSGLVRLISPFKSETNRTEINCFVSRFDIRNGLAESQALLFDTSHMSVIGAGTIDLKTERLDISLKPSPKDGAGSKQTGKLTLSLGELAKPFKLGGTLANPSLALDPEQTALMIGKTVGGIALFGPVGIAAALIGTASGDDNPCLAALDAAQRQQQASETSRQPQKRSFGSKASQSIKDFGNKLNKLFGTRPAGDADAETETATDNEG